MQWDLPAQIENFGQSGSFTLSYRIPVGTNVERATAIAFTNAQALGSEILAQFPDTQITDPNSVYRDPHSDQRVGPASRNRVLRGR